MVEKIKNIFAISLLCFLSDNAIKNKDKGVEYINNGLSPKQKKLKSKS